MPQRLGELLVAEKLLTPDQLDEAIEAQCLYGGRLGTSLIELGLLSEEEIARTLSRKLHLPYIEPDLLMKIPAEVIELVPQKLAWKHQVIPCRLEKKRLYLAMSDPTNLTTIDALAFRLGFIIVPVVVPEIRLMLALQKYYQLELSPRFQTLSQSLASRRQARRSPPAPVSSPPKSRPRKQRETDDEILDVAESDIIIDKNLDSDNWPLLGDKESLGSLSEEEYHKLINMPDHLRLGPADSSGQVGADRQVTKEVEKLQAEEQHPFVLLCKQLTEARSRDDIADAIIDHIAPFYAGAALLMVKGGVATGWKGAAEGEVLHDFDQLQIPLDQPSVLQTVAASKAFYLGPLQKEVNNILISSRFDPKPPESVLAIPLLLRGRLVTILYLQDLADKLLNQLPQLQKLVVKTSMAFEMLILANKIQMG